MTTKINFSKIQRCGQVWDDMPSCADGRLCQQCDRVIHDFRGMSDWNIALKHAHSTTKVCGIYDEATLSGGGIKQLRSLNRGRKALWAAAVAGLTSITNIDAQVQTDEPVHLIEQDLEVRDSFLDQRPQGQQYNSGVDSLRIVKGKIIDSSTQEGIIAASIVVQGTDHGMVSDMDGNFSIDLSQQLSIKDSVKLVISYVGYAKVELVIHADHFKSQKTVVLEEEIIMAEDLTLTTFGVVLQPWYKRVWNKITRIFR